MPMEVDRVRLLSHDSDSDTNSARVHAPPHRVSKGHRRCLTWRRLRLGLYAVGAASAVALVVAVVPLKQSLEAASAWIDLHPLGSVLLLPMLFSIAIPLAIPATLLEIASGSVFGLVQGTAMNAVGKTCGALVAFLVGKRLGKQRLGSYLQVKFPVFTALSRVVEGPNWKPLLLLQLSSLPPVVKCYGLSITDVSLLRFAITSFIGGLPSALLWASIGHQTKDALVRSTNETDGDHTNSGGRWLVLLIGVACTVLAMGFLFVYTRRELKAQLQHVKKSKKIHPTGQSGAQEQEDEDSENEALLHEMQDDVCEVVITQVIVTDTEQQVAKRISMV